MKGETEGSALEVDRDEPRDSPSEALGPQANTALKDPRLTLIPAGIQRPTHLGQVGRQEPLAPVEQTDATDSAHSTFRSVFRRQSHGIGAVTKFPCARSSLVGESRLPTLGIRLCEPCIAGRQFGIHLDGLLQSGNTVIDSAYVRQIGTVLRMRNGMLRIELQGSLKVRDRQIGFARELSGSTHKLQGPWMIDNSLEGIDQLADRVLVTAGGDVTHDALWVRRVTVQVVDLDACDDLLGSRLLVEVVVIHRSASVKDTDDPIHCMRLRRGEYADEQQDLKRDTAIH